jgi:hypothetical protein
MPDPGVRTSELGVLSALTDDDRLVVVDDPAGSASTKTVAVSTVRAAVSRTAPPATTGNAVSYVETLRQDMPVFMDGLADLLAHLLTEGALDRRMARR